MNAELAPKHEQKIGDNYVLWFESSNSYVIISEKAYHFLNCYFESKDKKAFIQQLGDQFNFPNKQAEAYYSDLIRFLNDLSSKAVSVELPSVPILIPNSDFSYNYTFGDSDILINFSSVKILELIHPYLRHAHVENCSDVETVFDIFSKDNLLCLYKNKSFIGSYETANFHFLQGKFAMELVASMYKNFESDWLATFHASTVCNDKEAIMIIGDSGNGKSTLSALLMSQGYDLLADDFTPMLAKNQHLYRFPAAISIKEGAFELMASLFDDFQYLEPQINSSKRLTVKYLPPLKQFRNAQKHFECTKIVMVNYSTSGASELRECPSEKLLKTLIPDAWISPCAQHSKIFLNWLKTVKFYELSYSKNEVAVAKFKELFEL